MSSARPIPRIRPTPFRLARGARRAHVLRALRPRSRTPAPTTCATAFHVFCDTFHPDRHFGRDDDERDAVVDHLQARDRGVRRCSPTRACAATTTRSSTAQPRAAARPHSLLVPLAPPPQPGARGGRSSRTRYASPCRAPLRAPRRGADPQGRPAAGEAAARHGQPHRSGQRGPRRRAPRGRGQAEALGTLGPHSGAACRALNAGAGLLREPDCRNLASDRTRVFYALAIVDRRHVRRGDPLHLPRARPSRRAWGSSRRSSTSTSPARTRMYLGAGGLLRRARSATSCAPTDARDALARAGAEVGRRLRRHRPDHRSALGRQGLGHVLDVGPAAHDRAAQRADLRGVPRAPRLRGRRRRASGGSRRRSASSARPTCPSSTSACRSGAASTRWSSPARGGGLQHPDMKIALGRGFLCFTLLAPCSSVARARGSSSSRSRLRRAEEDAIDLGLDTRTEA